MCLTFTRRVDSPRETWLISMWMRIRETRPLLAWTALVGVGLLFPGCQRELPPPTADLPSLAGLQPDPARLPAVAPPPPEEVLQVSHLLVRYQGAVESARRLPRTRACALERARHLAALARGRQHTLGELARRYSEDTRTNWQDGSLGPRAPGELHPDLEAAARALHPGQVSDPVETPAGFHVLRRDEPRLIQAGEILVTYDGAQRYSPREPRSLDEARALAEAIHRRLRAGASFEDEARAHSDLENAGRGGFFMPFAPGAMHPKFEEMVLALPDEGGLGDVVETPTGFHIVIRLPLRRARVRLLGVEVREEPALPPERRRSREEAFARARALRARALEPGADFAALVARESEHATRTRGGLLVLEGRGRHHPALERAAFDLAPGEISTPFEADGLVYVLRRVPFHPEP